MKTVYWAPLFRLPEQASWGLSLESPRLVLPELQETRMRTEATRNDSWFVCTSFLEFSKNLYYMPNPIETALSFDLVNNDIYALDSSNKMTTANIRTQMVKDAVTVTFNYGMIFFSEESLSFTAYPSFMHRSSWGDQGYCIPGVFDISKWFRPVSLEIQLNPGITSLKIPKNDPLFYFKTNEEISLQKFFMTDKLLEFMSSCVGFKQLEPKKPLSYLYDRFNKSGNKQQILKEIRSNLVNE